MSVKIVLPRGADLKTGAGVKVFTSKGSEINGISSISINIQPDEVITANIKANVSDIENLDGITALIGDMPIGFIESEVEKHGYKLVKKCQTNGKE